MYNACVPCVHVCHGEGRPGCQPAEIIYSIPLPFEFAVVVRCSTRIVISWADVLMRQHSYQVPRGTWCSGYTWRAGRKARTTQRDTIA